MHSVLANKQLFELYCSTSKSKAEILRKFGLKPGSDNYKTLVNYSKLHGIDLPIYDPHNQKRILALKNYVLTGIKLPVSRMLTEHSKYSRADIKRGLLREKLLEYKCAECEIENIWNNKKISLQLDHINGIRDDNRLFNLRFLCPNCHSQTDTYSSKRLKKKRLDNQKQLDKFRKLKINKEELELLIWKYPATEIGKMFNVSDKAIEKRCKLYNIQKPNRGYWTKLKYSS